MNPALKQSLDEAMTEMLLDICPDAVLVPMYGGLMIEAVAGDKSSRMGGYFFYAKHMSLEFTHGAALENTDGVLEGKGKLRRHIKIRTLQELEEKNCRAMLIQAIGRLDELA